MWAVLKWLVRVSFTVVKWAVANPLGVTILGVVTVASGAWIATQRWAGAKEVGGLIGALGGVIISAGVGAWVGRLIGRAIPKLGLAKPLSKYTAWWMILRGGMWRRPLF